MGVDISSCTGGNIKSADLEFHPEQCEVYNVHESHQHEKTVKASQKHTEIKNSAGIYKIIEATQYVNEIIEKGEPWTDVDFPPEMKSIGENLDELNQKDYKWRRAS